MQSLPDDAILADLLYSQETLAGRYSGGAMQCSHAPVRNEMLSLMNEEHRLHAVVLDEMEKRMLCGAAAADQQARDDLKQKFKSLIE